MPQAAAAPKQETAEQKAQREFDEHWAEVVKGATEGDSPGARQIRRAIELERQVASTREKVNDNRTYLRLMDRNDELSDVQAEFVDVFYSEKESGVRKPREETQATRRAKILARKDNGTS